MISAKIIADSISGSQDRITTFELEYPRFIHSELMTHRVFSRNAASSRAIPIHKVIEQVRNYPAKPSKWGLNQAGMSASKSLEDYADISNAIDVWKEASKKATESAESLNKLGLHKQIVNRVLEPFHKIKTIVTATDFDNFFYLRVHEDAQPEIRILAEMMKSEMSASVPSKLYVGEWHLPYIDKNWTVHQDSSVSFDKYLSNKLPVSLEDAKKISASCCAQVSYRVLDEDLGKAKRIYDQLVGQKPVHASPFEHLATPMKISNCYMAKIRGSVTLWEKGVTHMDKNYNLWSGNFKGWIQFRQTIDNHVFSEY